jgi:RNA polymerase sigma-70 factor (ECF subfamily)
MRLLDSHQAEAGAAALLAKPGNSASGPRLSALSSAGQDIDPALLHDTQAYLVCQIERRHLDWQLLQSWEHFYQIYNPLIRRFAVQCGVPPADFDDCVQHVWVELVRRLHSFRYDPNRCRFRSWLYRIVRGKVIDLHRYQTSHPTVNLSSSRAAELRSHNADPGACCEQQCQRELVQRVLAKLRRRVSELSYRVLHLRWMEGFTVAEVGACLGLTPRQVWFCEYRLKRKFRCLFDQYKHNNGHGDS